jgi:hypothetical protein
LPEPEKLLQFKLPEVKEVEAYFVRLKDGRVVARTAEELAVIKKETEEAGAQPGKSVKS